MERCINNAFYDELGDQWIDAVDHPVSLLRSENKLRNPWILEEMQKREKRECPLLDIGCGAGLLTNFLARKGYKVTGIDLSSSSLEIARKEDRSQSVRYEKANAYHLPFDDHSFDVVCAMDVLEHVESPEKLISEASRILKKGGLFFFHTFNRTFLSYLLVIKGVEWFVRNAPPNMHLYSLFIKPEELKDLCLIHSLEVESVIGVRPDFSKAAFWKMLMTRYVSDNFAFRFTSSLGTGYSGLARKV
jgi:2-polyprenyl-6-hydroxyphenyl methylase / 3-demethylubiquinone-9 3-methyltransferase